MKAAIISTSRIAQKALEVARAELGITESPDGTHDGKKIREYLSAVNAGRGNPWNMAFIFWAYRKAAASMDIECPLASVPGVYAQFDQLIPSALLIDKILPSRHSSKAVHLIDVRKTEITPKHLREADIFLMQYVHGLWHCGIIEKVCGDSIITIEGCINSGNTKNQIGVYEKRRKIDQVKRIIRVV